MGPGFAGGGGGQFGGDAAVLAVRAAALHIGLELKCASNGGKP